MASIEENLQELEYVKQAFKDNFDNYGVSTSGVEFRNMPNLLVQMEKILPSQVKEVTPTTSAQHVSADEGFKLTGVNVNAVTSDIDANIQANNIKKGVDILGVTGTLEATSQPVLQEKTVAPDVVSQSIEADAGYDGLSKVDLLPVTSAIDENIKAENIKSGTTILGVTGTLEEGGGELAGYNVESIVSEDGASQTLKITSGFSANGNPIEVATDEEMTNALTQANLGKVYKFTGTSSTYETDAIYIVSEVE